MAKILLKERFSREDLFFIIDYNPDEGTANWKVRSKEMFSDEKYCKTWNKRFAGKSAIIYSVSGGKRIKSYLCPTIAAFGKRYQATRIIWFLMTGEEPPEEIDHFDHNPSNNRWDNLVASNRKMNSRNLPKTRANTSGSVGVRQNYPGSWTARVMVDGKELHLGSFKSKNAAELAAKSKREELGFSENHGT